MKKIILICAILQLASFEVVSAQTDSAFFSADSLKEDSTASFTLFTAKYFEGIAWLHWNVAGQKSDGHYLVFKSTDGKSFSLLGIKSGIGVPIQTPIAYYMQDKNPAAGIVFYKVMHVSEKHTWMGSDIVKVEVAGVPPRDTNASAGAVNNQ